MLFKLVGHRGASNILQTSHYLLTNISIWNPDSFKISLVSKEIKKVIPANSFRYLLIWFIFFKLFFITILLHKGWEPYGFYGGIAVTGNPVISLNFGFSIWGLLYLIIRPGKKRPHVFFWLYFLMYNFILKFFPQAGHFQLDLCDYPCGKRIYDKALNCQMCDGLLNNKIEKQDTCRKNR